jgi:Golgi SNAP receptor complex protein 1
MRECSSDDSPIPVHNQEALVKRYHEIHYDYSTEFRNTVAAVNRKRESMELFHTSKKMHAGEEDSSMAKLLRERSGIAASMKSIHDIISQAFETKETLGSQRSSMSGATGGLSTLTANVPSFNRLIDGIQKKKYRESLIVALFAGFLICFSIWWIFMK